MKRTLLCVLSASALAALSYHISWRVVARADQPRWKPFTAVMVQRMYVGNAIAPMRTENYIHAVREDGSQAEDFKRQVMPNGGWGDARVVSDLSARKRTSIEPSTESVTTYPYSDRTVARLAMPPSPSSCSSNANAPHAALLGYDTVMVQTAFPAAPGEKMELTQWRAPALDCFSLKEILTHYIPDHPSGKTTKEALFVAEGEPSASLFEIPTGYVERSPSQVFAERALRFPDEAGDTPDKSGALLDGVYQSYLKAR